MSYGEELMMEMLIQSEIYEREREETINDLWDALKRKLWISDDKKYLKISKMSDRHIINFKAMLERKRFHDDDQLGDVARSYIELFDCELKKRHPPRDATEGFYEEWEDEFIAESLL